MSKGRPPYVPTAEERKALSRLRYLTDRGAKIHDQREELITDLTDRGVPALQIARAARIHPSTLSMRFSRRQVAGGTGN